MITTDAVHLGVVGTSFGVEAPAAIQRLLIPFLRLLMKTPSRGAATSTYAASAPELDQVTGRYLANNKIKTSSPRGFDQAIANRLWHISAHLVHLPTTPAAQRSRPSLRRLSSGAGALCCRRAGHPRRGRERPAAPDGPLG